ncbi:putative signal transduction protein p25, partial [Operophtera brumata]
MDNKRDGNTMTLYRSDYWMRQSKIIDDRKVTMCDTGLLWWRLRSVHVEATGPGGGGAEHDQLRHPGQRAGVCAP